MNFLSINLGVNGSLTLMVNGKVMKHMSFLKLNHDLEGKKSLLTEKTISRFLENTGIILPELERMVMVGYDHKLIGIQDFNVVVEDIFDIPFSNYIINPNGPRRIVKSLPSLLPPYTDRPYNFISGYVIHKGISIPLMIVDPNVAYSSVGYYTSKFTKSINVTVSSNDSNPYDGSLVTTSNSNHITVVDRPKISVGKVYTKMTELLGFGRGNENYSTIPDISPRFNIPDEYKDIIDEGVNNRLSDLKDNYTLKLFNEITNSGVTQLYDDDSVIPYRSYMDTDHTNKFVVKMASVTQRLIENTVIKLIEDSIKSYSSNFTNNITLSGDVFLNRRLNSKIMDHFKGYNVHISTLSDETSLSLGGAMYVNSLMGNRRMYDSVFILSTSPYTQSFKNNGKEIDYKLLSEKLSKNIISFNYKNPECGYTTKGYTGYLFDVGSGTYEKCEDKVSRFLYEKPNLVILEDSYKKYFKDTPYTYHNNTISTPIKPHLFKEFIHDDGTLNIFVINQNVNESLYGIIKNTDREFIGLSNLTNKKFKPSSNIETLFYTNSLNGAIDLIIDDKTHFN